MDDFGDEPSNDEFEIEFRYIDGCYSLMASWPGGHWEINFAAGQ